MSVRRVYAVGQPEGRDAQNVTRTCRCTAIRCCSWAFVAGCGWEWCTVSRGVTKSVLPASVPS